MNDVLVVIVSFHVDVQRDFGRIMYECHDFGLNKFRFECWGILLSLTPSVLV